MDAERDLERRKAGFPERDTASYLDLVLAILWAHPRGVTGTWPLQHLAFKCAEALGLDRRGWCHRYFGMYNPEVASAFGEAYGIGLLRSVHDIHGVTYQLNTAGRKIVRDVSSKLIPLDVVRDVVRREWRTAKTMGESKKVPTAKARRRNKASL